MSFVCSTGGFGRCEGSTSWRMLRLGGCKSDVEKKATTHEVPKVEFEKTHTHTNTLACFVRQRMCLRGKDCSVIISDSFDAHFVGGFLSEEYFEGTPANFCVSAVQICEDNNT